MDKRVKIEKASSDYLTYIANCALPLFVSTGCLLVPFLISNEIFSFTFVKRFWVPLTIGVAAGCMYVWMYFNYFAVTVTENGITLDKWDKCEHLLRSDIKYVKKMDFYINRLSIYKVHTKKGKTFYVHSDYPTQTFLEYQRAYMVPLMDKLMESFNRKIN